MDRKHFVVIDGSRESEVSAALDATAVRLGATALSRALGWELKPEGLCKDASCVPLAARPGFVTDEGVDLQVFAELLERPLAIDLQQRVAVLGASAAQRGTQLASLEAPDFSLPDLEGRQHSLSQHRGKKVLLLAYASW